MSVISEHYLARAAECARDAASADLQNVRDRYLRSEAAWQQLAARALKTDAARALRDAEKASNIAVNDG
ncbi:MAG: hypothetical protein M0R03_14380 [Novosphingobium sp.]|nr:hypothetical protein [Novosphingobium sp.]